MDRPFPLGLPNNPAQGLRRGPRPPRLQSASRDVPRSSLETSASAAVGQYGASSNTPISPGQVVKLTREAFEKAVADEESRANDAEASAIQGDTLTLRPGVTIDLSRENIPVLPDEIVDIIKEKLERLALNHNFISDFPARFSECMPLRHIAVRNNALETFPLPLCELKQLEYLDLGLNKIKVLPAEISNLTSLRAFAVYDNQIEDLPQCIGDMASLVRFNVDGNPIKFPPEVLQVPEGTEGAEAMEIKTTNIKNFLKQGTSAFPTPVTATPLTESPKETVSEEAVLEEAETPRLPALASRRLSNRFPIKVKGGSVPDLRSPVTKGPPVPSKSHSRGMSQYSTRPPGLIPLTIGQIAENRPQTSWGKDKPLPREPLAPRFPRQTVSSPEEPSLQLPLYVRQLSSVPIRRGEPKTPEPVSDVAQGILYSIFQVHLPIQTLMGLTNDGTAKRSSLEMVFYNTNVYLQELDQAIKENRGIQDSIGIQRAYITLINAYLHVCSRLASNVDILVDNGDRRYIRTFLMSLYHTIMELRVVASKYFPSYASQRAVPAISIARYEPSNPYKQPVDPDTGEQRYSPYGPGTTAIARTPRSAASFASSVLSNEEDYPEDPEELFRRFYSSIDQTSELVLKILPPLNAKFRAGLREARADTNRTEPLTGWEQLVARCANAIHQGELLRGSLMNVSVNPPGGATPQFWALCSALFTAWASFGNHLAQSMDLELAGVQLGTKEGIRRIARSMKDSIHLMVLCRQAGVGAGEADLGPREVSPQGQKESVPTTPQSAAPGPAAQVTIPSM